MGISANVKNFRKKAGLSQMELAEKTGLSIATIQGYEQGKYNPKINALTKLCVALDCKITDLIDEDSKKYYRMFDNINTKPVAFDNAIHKFQNKEDLTYEEENAIIEYVKSEQFEQEKENIKEIAKKAYKHISYLHSNSYASSAEELDKLQDAKQIELEKKTDSNVHKYHSSIRVNITPEIKEINRIQNELLNDKNNVTPEELKILTDYYHSEQFQNSFKRLREVAKTGLAAIERLQTACEQLNEVGQEKVAEHAEMIAKIPEYQKKPDAPSQE